VGPGEAVGVIDGDGDVVGTAVGVGGTVGGGVGVGGRSTASVCSVHISPLLKLSGGSVWCSSSLVKIYTLKKISAPLIKP